MDSDTALRYANEILRLKSQAEASKDVSKINEYKQLADSLREDLVSGGYALLAEKVGYDKPYAQARSLVDAWAQAQQSIQPTYGSTSTTSTTATTVSTSTGGLMSMFQQMWNFVAHGDPYYTPPTVPGQSVSGVTYDAPSVAPATATTTLSLTGIWSVLTQLLNVVIKYLPVILLIGLIQAAAKMFKLSVKLGGGRR